MKKILKSLNERLEITACVFLMSLMTVIIFIQVIARYVFHHSLSWSEELARYLFIWLIYIGVSFGAKQMKHLRIEAGLYFFPKKLRKYIVVLGDVLFLGFALFATAASFNIVQKQIFLGQTSPALGIPMSIIYAAPMVGFGLTTIRQIQTIFYRVEKVRSIGKEDNNG